MLQYLKIFDTHSDYEDYIEGSSAMLPNVSLCADNNYEVHYNPVIPDYTVTCTYDVQDAGEGVALYCYLNSGVTGEPIVIGAENFDKIEIDGTEAVIEDLDLDEGWYTFDATGEHTVVFTMKTDEIPLGIFAGSGQTSVIIGNGIKVIGDYAFDSNNLTTLDLGSVSTIGNGVFRWCENLFNSPLSVNSIIIPSSVTYLGEECFIGCSNLESNGSIAIYATTPPEIVGDKEHGGPFWQDIDVETGVGLPVIYVPDDSISAYQNDQNWGGYQFTPLSDYEN